MGGLFGGGGGGTTIINPASSATSNNPAPGQVFQPPGQQQMAGLFQGLENQLNNLAWSGLSSLPGGVTAPTQLYPQFQDVAQGIAGVNPDIPGYGGPTYAWGPYGNLALTGALNAANYTQNLTSPAFNAQVNEFLPLGAQAAQNVYSNAYNPLFSSAISGIAQNPWFAEAAAGAQNQAAIGAQTAGMIGPEAWNVAANAPGLTSAGQQAAQSTANASLPLWGLQTAQADLAGQLSNQALGLNPQLIDLYAQTIPGLETLAAGLPQQTQGIAQQAQGLYGALAPQYGNIAQRAQDAARANARNVNALFQQTVPGIEQAAAGVSALGNRTGYGMGVMPEAARQILQTGFDPQRALFNQQQQQLTDQANAAAAMSGLGSSPYAAGLTSKALSDFDINWQNQQLQRQATAGQAAQGLFGQTAANAATKAGIQAQGAGLLNMAGQLGGGLEQQILSGRLAGGQLGLGALQGQANLGLGTEAQQLQALLGGAAGAGNLISQAGNLGLGITGQQLANVTGAGNIFNQQAQGAGALGSTLGSLAGAGLNQQILGQQGTANQLQAALGLGTGAAGLAGSSAAALYNLQNQQQNELLRALQAQNQAGAQGAGALAALTGQQGTALQTGLAAQLGQAQALGLPYQTATGQAQNALNALTGQANFGNQLLNLPQQSLQNLESYLGLGQSASALGGELGNLGFRQNQAQLGNIGALANSLLGGGTLGNLAFGSQGLSGALGLGQGGLLGSFGGGGLGGLGGFGGAAQDFSAGITGAGDIVNAAGLTDIAAGGGSAALDAAMAALFL